ncbi:hypothetical protein A3F59_06385 [Candidatus Roizmanbacteria bacterium RIFCSPHIGHO2_12_FULL_38_13]|nr:MAG: hypothetical protein A2684_00020 [Candidatus Levybacteria bacterium RIFCSPHIGHO2_01_FULL_36_15b]OGK34639.1 MAG: hypothetical protein A3F59_06385 [Candidatus Roizmanbacteria bacterium RIFCSPHIGHO2_12_FULL_38_13]
MATTKKSFLDAYSNASGFGIVFLIFGLVTLLFAIVGNSFVEGSPKNLSILSLTEGVLLLTTGYGLMKRKLMGIYSLGLLIALSIILFIYNMGQGFSITESLSYTLIIYAILFIWFYSARNSFHK